MGTHGSIANALQQVTNESAVCWKEWRSGAISGRNLSKEIKRLINILENADTLLKHFPQSRPLCNCGAKAHLRNFRKPSDKKDKLQYHCPECSFKVLTSRSTEEGARELFVAEQEDGSQEEGK